MVTIYEYVSVVTCMTTDRRDPRHELASLHSSVWLGDVEEEELPVMCFQQTVAEKYSIAPRTRMVTGSKSRPRINVLLSPRLPELSQEMTIVIHNNELGAKDVS